MSGADDEQSSPKRERPPMIGADSDAGGGANGQVLREQPRDLPGKVDEVPHRDKVRRALAYALVAILAATILFGVLLFALSRPLRLHTEDIRTIIEIFFPSMVTLVGTVTGFYFGSEHHRGDD